MKPSVHLLLMAAENHRKQAEAYEALATLLKRVNDGQEPAPVREIAEVLHTMGLCVVPRDTLDITMQILDPGDDDEASPQLVKATVGILRDIVLPHLAEKNPTKELPL